MGRGPAIGMLRDSIGRGQADAVVVGAVVLVVAMIAVVTLSVVHVIRLAARHRVGSTRGVIAVSVA